MFTFGSKKPRVVAETPEQELARLRRVVDHQNQALETLARFKFSSAALAVFSLLEQFQGREAGLDSTEVGSIPLALHLETTKLPDGTPTWPVTIRKYNQNGFLESVTPCAWEDFEPFFKKLI